jgi:hypothetical protein
MKLIIYLQDKDGWLVATKTKDMPEITCMSDASQRLPKHFVGYAGEIYGFSRLTERGAIFKKRLDLCV